MNVVLDIEVVPREFQRESRKVQEYVWEKVAKGEEALIILQDYLTHPEDVKYAEIRARIERFMALKPEFGRIVCIGLGHDAGMLLEKKAFTAECDEDEPRILGEFWEAMTHQQRDRRIVTFNGLAFDIPYILKRSLFTGVKPSTPLSLKRFALDSHYDVMQVLSNWDRFDAVRLDVIADLLGLEKHPPGMDGSQVYRLWKEHRFQEIETYCLNDVQLTYEIFLKVKESFR
jgi:DNA polymerase elongation subunit (family B)